MKSLSFARLKYCSIPQKARFIFFLIIFFLLNSASASSSSSITTWLASTMYRAPTNESSMPEREAAPLGPFSNADIVMILLTISVILRVANFHFFQIPSSVAMAFGAILMTVLLVIISYIPFFNVTLIIDALREILKDFPDLLLKYMLGFLLFAAAIEVDLRNLGRILTTVLALSVVSTLLSALIVAILTFFLMQNIAHMDFSWCLLFGAIVSPTDPVTVISILNDKPDLLPSSTKYFVIGESLLNDAVGVVLYLVMLEIVRRPDIDSLEIASLLFETVFVECVYGAAIGVFLAWLAYSAIVSVREPLLEVVITFVLVGNINMICGILNASIPLASVGAGLFIGNYAVTFAMNDEVSETFHEMWKLADETLNSILFLMIGAADLFWNPQELGWSRVLTLVVCTISISLVARFVAVALPLVTIILIEWLTGRRLRHRSVRYRGGTIGVLTWAGMRGGISIALALGVPDSFVKHAVPGHMTYGQLIFFMTFILVVFSIIVQGMLFEPVVKMINRVSFDIFSSGGLGTYVSSTSLGVGFNDGDYADVYDEEDSEHISGGEEEENRMESFISSGDNLWDAGGQQLYGDYVEEAPKENMNLIPEKQTRKDGYGTTLTGDGMSGDESSASALGTSAPPSVSIMLPLRARPPRPGTAGIERRASEMGFGRRDLQPGRIVPSNEHGRQGSVTFQNLPMLEEPPSVTTFLGDLRRRGTDSFAKWFDKGRSKHVKASDAERHQLRRSKTEPDNARLARGEKQETHSDADHTDAPSAPSSALPRLSGGLSRRSSLSRTNTNENANHRQNNRNSTNEPSVSFDFPDSSDNDA